MEVPNIKDMKLITGILYQGGGMKVLKELHGMGVNSACLHNARGSALDDISPGKGLPAQFAKEVLKVVVSGEKADEIFHFIFENAGINRPHGGLLYITNLQRATPYELPDIPEEKSE